MICEDLSHNLSQKQHRTDLICSLMTEIFCWIGFIKASDEKQYVCWENYSHMFFTTIILYEGHVLSYWMQ